MGCKKYIQWDLHIFQNSGRFPPSKKGHYKDSEKKWIKIHFKFMFKLIGQPSIERLLLWIIELTVKRQAKSAVGRGFCLRLM